MKTLKVILVLAVTLAASSAALATPNTASAAGKLWKALDTNQDAVISKEEASASQEISSQWDLLDLNQDGTLSEKEFYLVSLAK